MGLFRKKEKKLTEEELKKKVEETFEQSMMISQLFGKDFIATVKKREYDFSKNSKYEEYVKISFPEFTKKESDKSLEEYASDFIKKHECDDYVVSDGDKIDYKETLNNIIYQKFIDSNEKDLINYHIEEYYDFPKEISEEDKNTLAEEFTYAVEKNMLDKLFHAIAVNPKCLKGALFNLKIALKKDDSEENCKSIYIYLEENWDTIDKADDAYYGLVQQYAVAMIKFLIVETFNRTHKEKLNYDL